MAKINLLGMAKFRNVSVRFWSDPFIENLTPEKKYFFLYLITNEHSSQCGIYEVSFRQMAFETGYNQETIEKLIQYFESSGKIKYSKKTNEIAIKNFIKHNPQGSPKVKSFVEKELKNVKDRLLIPYLYAMDTVSQEEEEEEEEEEQTQEQEPVIDFKSALLSDQIFIEQLKIVNKGKNIEQAWGECYLYHSNTNNPPKELSDWKRKLTGWLSNKKAESIDRVNYKLQ